MGILPLSGQEADLKQSEELGWKGAGFWGSMLAGGGAASLAESALLKGLLAGASGAGAFKLSEEIPGIQHGSTTPEEAVREIATASTFGALTGGVLAKTPALIGLGSKAISTTTKGSIHIANSLIDRLPGGPGVRESTQKFVQSAYRNLWDRGFTSGQELLTKVGLDPLRTQLAISRSVSGLMGGKYVANQSRSFKGLTDEEVRQVTHIMETQDLLGPEAVTTVQGLPDNLVRVAKAEAGRLRDFGEALQKAGVQIYDPETGFHSFVLRNNYVPHRFVNPEIYRPEGEFREATITQVMKKLDMTKDRATEWVDAFAERLQAEQAGILADRPISFGTSHFLQGRNLELPGYETDLRKILPQYYEYGSRRWANHVMFGPVTPELKAVQKASEQLDMFPQEQAAAASQPSHAEQLFIEDFQNVRGRGVLPTKIDKELSPKEIVQERLLTAQKELRAARSVEQRYPRAFSQLEAISDPSQKEIARRIVSRQLGAMETDQLGRTTQGLLSSAAKAEVITKLALGAIAQPSQMLSAVVRTGYKGALGNLFKTVSNDPEALDFALRSGVILKSVVRQSEESLTGKAGTDFLEKVYFTQMDMKSRVFGALQGATFAQFQARALRQLSTLPRTVGNLAKMARIERRLTDLGFDTTQIVRRGGHLTQDELLLAAQKVSSDVNFWGDSMSLPEVYRSPYGRYLTMFKSFGFQQGKLFKDTIAKPAAKWLQTGGREGDLGPLTRFAVVTPLGGEIIADLKKWARGRKRTTNDVERVMENIANAAGFGLAADAMESTKYGLGGVLGWGVGPIATDVGKLVHNIGQASRGDAKPLAKQTIETLVPAAVGIAAPGLAPAVAAAAPAVSNILLPPKDVKK